jgi:hypothetical protein
VLFSHSLAGLDLLSLSHSLIGLPLTAPPTAVNSRPLLTASPSLALLNLQIWYFFFFKKNSKLICLTSFLYMLVIDFFCFQMENEEVMGGTSEPVDKVNLVDEDEDDDDLVEV